MINTKELLKTLKMIDAVAQKSGISHKEAIIQIKKEYESYEHCPNLYLKDTANYPEGYCLKYISALYDGINCDCGRDCKSVEKCNNKVREGK